MFSIIIPCHNYGKFLLDCVNSIDFDNQYLTEIIIVNDNSNDETSEIIDSLKKKIKIKSFNVKFNSLAKTINYAVNMTETEYFSRIDPDDTFHQLFFDEMINNHINDNFDFIYGDLIKKIENKLIYFKQYNNKYARLFSHPLSNGTLIKKKKFIEVGGLNENLKFKDDYDLWLKLNKSNTSIKYVNNPTFIYNRHDRNMSNNIFKKKLTYLKLLFNSII